MLSSTIYIYTQHICIHKCLTLYTYKKNTEKINIDIRQNVRSQAGPLPLSWYEREV